MNFQPDTNGNFISKRDNSGYYEWHIRDKSLINKILNANTDGLTFSQAE